MGKGKRKGGLTGVSKFVFESMKSDSADGNSHDVASLKETTVEETRDYPVKKKKKNDGSAFVEETALPETRWVDKYYATGLVPHYTHASQVPEHLQKCEYVYPCLCYYVSC